MSLLPTQDNQMHIQLNEKSCCSHVKNGFSAQSEKICTYFEVLDKSMEMG